MTARVRLLDDEPMDGEPTGIIEKPDVNMAQVVQVVERDLSHLSEPPLSDLGNFRRFSQQPGRPAS